MMIMMIKIKIRTPIWTGDIDQKSRLLQPTGIMGSLRWWTEVILRSTGEYYACDPTGDNKCPHKEKGVDEKYYCLGCLIFGATGIRRMFKLDISGGESTFNGDAINIKPKGRNRGWYLGSGVVGEIDLKITPLDKDFDEALVLLPLVIASNWGGIGAKTQHGYGVVKIENYPKVGFEEFKNIIKKLISEDRLSRLGIGLRQKQNDNTLPSLNEMFFAKVQFEANDEWWNEWWKKVNDPKISYTDDLKMKEWVKHGSVPIAPSIKNWLRYEKGKELWKPDGQNRDKDIENWLFGTIRNKKMGSKINISSAYKVSDDRWEFRIWGWIPRHSPSGFDRDKFLNKLKQALDGSGSITIHWSELLGKSTKNHKLKVWREYNSPRDTVEQNERDISHYIQSLLGSGRELNDL